MNKTVYKERSHIYPDNAVAVIIVHFGDVRVTNRCIQSLSRFAADTHVFIANNGGLHDHDQLERKITHRYPDLQLKTITLPCNKGFGSGCNAAIKEALKHAEIKWLWLLNNDAYITRNTLHALKVESRSFPNAIIGATILHSDAPDNIQVAGGCSYNSLTSIIRPHHTNKPFASLQTLPHLKLSYVNGASMFMSRALVERVGFFDERFFLYCEEVDYCRRAISMGFSLRWCKQAIVYHKGGASTGSTLSDPIRATKRSTYHETRSAILYTVKHIPSCLPILLLLRSIGKMHLLCYRRQFSLIPSVIFGIVDAFIYFKPQLSGKYYQPYLIVNKGSE
ncbi:MAG: hypothetical protein CSA22_10015 [Deltaproteobacteria bacterium]|nr:MAG: hypothetical protein CSA22_10015 [Deltaproteobacteria bacterium]